MNDNRKLFDTYVKLAKLNLQLISISDDYKDCLITLDELMPELGQQLRNAREKYLLLARKILIPIVNELDVKIGKLNICDLMTSEEISKDKNNLDGVDINTPLEILRQLNIKPPTI